MGVSAIGDADLGLLTPVRQSIMGVNQMNGSGPDILCPGQASGRMLGCTHQQIARPSSGLPL